MSTMNEMLSDLGYSERKIQGIAQLLLMQDESGYNAFDNFSVLMSKKEYSPQEQRWVGMVQGFMERLVILDEWSVLKKGLPIWQNSEIVNSVLETPCSLTRSELFKFLLAITQLQFFVKSAKYGNSTGTTNIYELDDRKKVSFATQQVINKLGFCNSRFYHRDDGPIDSVFLHAATEIALRQRLVILKSLSEVQEGKIKVFYSTNPRGLSKTEQSTAEILASWFSSDAKLQDKITSCIRAVCKDQSFKPDWYSNLNQLRNKILVTLKDELGLEYSEFPSAPDGEIYSPVYAHAAELEGRDPLDNKWPHIGHLLSHLAKILGINTQQVEFELLLVPGVKEGTRYIPAKTHEILEAFYTQVSLNEDKPLIYISDNSVTHSASRQDLMARLLQEKHGIKMDMITYHDGLDPEYIEVERVYKEITAELHTLFELFPLIERKFEHADDVNFDSVGASSSAPC